jgi:hypothetical protein
MRSSIELPDWCPKLRMSHSRAVLLLTRVGRLHKSEAYVGINIQYYPTSRLVDSGAPLARRWARMILGTQQTVCVYHGVAPRASFVSLEQVQYCS